MIKRKFKFQYGSRPLNNDLAPEMGGENTRVVDKKAQNIVNTANKHIVKQGDNLSKIAKQYNTSVEALAKFNNIQDINKIGIGQSINIPKKVPYDYSQHNLYDKGKIYPGFDESKINSEEEIHKSYLHSGKLEPYTIVDKKRQKIVNYDKHGLPMNEIDILTGSQKGDAYTLATKNKQLQRRTTPAGTYVVDNFPDEERQSYNRLYEGNILPLKSHSDYGVRQATSIHQIPTTQPQRNELIKDDNLDNNRVSQGCINCTKEDYEKYLQDLKAGHKIHVLPEDDGNYFQYEDGNLAFKTNRQVNYGQYNYTPPNEPTQKITPYKNKQLTENKSIISKYNPLLATPSIPQQTEKALNDNKVELMKQFNISNADYNKLASQVPGIMANETETGKGFKYSMGNDLAERIYGKVKGVNPINYSQGLAQNRLSLIPENIRTKYDLRPENMSNPNKSAIATMTMLNDSKKTLNQAKYRNQYNMTPDNINYYAGIHYNNPRKVEAGNANLATKGYVAKLKQYSGLPFENNSTNPLATLKKHGGKINKQNNYKISNVRNKYEYGGRIGDESFLGRTSKVGPFVGIDTIPKRKLTPKVGIGKYQWALANGAMKPQHNSGLQVRSKMGGKVKKYQTAGNTGLSPIKNLSDIRGNAGYDSTGKKSTTIMNPTFTGGFNNTLATFNPNLQFAGSKLVSKDINAGLLHSRANFDLKSDYSNNNGKQLLNNSAQYNNGMFNAGVTSKVGTDQKPIYGVSAGVNLNGIKATGGFEYGDNKRTSNVAATADGYRGSGSVNYNRVYDEKTGNATTTAGATYASRKGLTTGIDYTGGTGNKSVDAKVGFTGDNGYVQGNVGYGTNNANANIAGEYNNTGVTKKGNQWSVGVKGGMTFGKKFGGTVKKKVYMTGGKLFDSGGDMNFNALKEQRKKLGPNVTYSMTNVFGKDKQENGWIFGSNSEPKPETTLPKINNVMKVETKPGQLITQMPPLKSLEANTNNYLADVNSFKEQVAHIESRGNYNAMNKDTKATGKYQFIPRYHKEEVARLFGVDWNTFYTKPELQERYMDYWTEKTLRPTAQKLLAQYPNAGYNINQLMGMVHFQGEGGARSQLKQGTTNTKVGYNAITTDQYVKRIK